MAAAVQIADQAVEVRRHRRCARAMVTKWRKWKDPRFDPPQPRADHQFCQLSR